MPECGWIDLPLATWAITVVAGTMFGLVVLVVNGVVGLPIAARLFGGGKPISD